MDEAGAELVANRSCCPARDLGSHSCGQKRMIDSSTSDPPGVWHLWPP